MATQAQLETAAYLGMPESMASDLPDGLVAAVTATHLGIVPQAWLDQGFADLPDSDKEQVLKFARFLMAAGKNEPDLTEAGR